ncbi:MAG: NADH-quinone oxidoreductase subunit A [Deltaproteobacteria bacterium]|nr:MAG: NADH-quinone oxidoreductase subunit A [Deltaproteobacteria bacterium]
MSDDLLIQYLYIISFLIGAFLSAFAPFIISYLVAPKRFDSSATIDIYECGMKPYGEMWDFKYGAAYYLYALIFLAFDIDVLYLFPVASAFETVSSSRGIFEMFLFIGILSLAIVYAWVKGVFSWEGKKV